MLSGEDMAGERWKTTICLISKKAKCKKNISKTLADGFSATSLFLANFDVICDLFIDDDGDDDEYDGEEDIKKK